MLNCSASYVDVCNRFEAVAVTFELTYPVEDGLAYPPHFLNFE